MLPLPDFAQGSLIWSRTFSTGGGSAGIVGGQADFWFGPNGSYIGNPLPYPSQLLFNQISFGTNDVGQTFTIASQADDINFNFVVNALTNGIDQSFIAVIGASPGGVETANYESQLFAGVGTGPDLIGYQIQSVGLSIDSLTFQSTFNEQVTLNIYGIPVPEPSPSWLVLLGGGVFIYARSFCKKYSGFYFNGDIAEMLIFSRVLT